MMAEMGFGYGFACEGDRKEMFIYREREER